MTNADSSGLHPILLSPPDMSGLERDHLLRAFDSNWIAPVGPDLDAFEREVAAQCGRRHAVALSSGSAALHLALWVIGVRPSDEVLVGTYTFAATVNAVLMAGATPVLVDSEPHSWGIDPELVHESLAERTRVGRPPAAVVAVDVYGQCADHDALEAVCARFDVPLVVDAAESLGAWRGERPAGSRGRLAAVSFNGNKIATCGGGGALLTDSDRTAQRARKLATQAREDAPHYEHLEMGFNYRLSNLLAAVGRAQLERLPQIVDRRRAIRRRYVEWLGHLPGIGFMPVPAASDPNDWLTVMTLGADAGVTPGELRVALAAEGIESRPTWKPMHRQPYLQGAESIVTGVADEAFRTGLCLPSGSVMSDADVDRVIAVVSRTVTRAPAASRSVADAVGAEVVAGRLAGVGTD